LIHLSPTAVRTLHLAAQGLLAPPRRRATKDDVLAAIRRMAQLQIDTIHVVARSPYLVLFSRLGAYDPEWLDQHLAEGRLFEYWSHEACFVPIEDFRLLRHRMLDPAGMGWKYSVRWHQEYAADIARILEQIRLQGPVKSSDFARVDGKGGGWWDWKPEKRHLEVLLTTGQLMIAERRNFQRVYDLTERVLPEWDDKLHALPAEAAQQEMVRLSCAALGVVRADWVADYYRLRKGRYEAALHALADAGELLPARVDGWRGDVFVHHTLADRVDDAAQARLKSSVTTVLSPFDPVVWDRKRAAAMFDFDYTIECYTPAHKRQYGYFVLPLLSRGKLVGRLDAKAHRAQQLFEVKSLHLEPGVRVSERLLDDIGIALRRCAAWHGTPEVKVIKAPAGVARALNARK
jgi:uncharacterized protein